MIEQTSKENVSCYDERYFKEDYTLNKTNRFVINKVENTAGLADI